MTTSTIRGLRAAACTLLLLGSLSGCKVLQEPGTEDSQLSVPTTCGEFLEASEDERAEVYGDTETVTYYSAESATAMTGDELFALVCAKEGGEASLDELYFTWTFAECELWATLTPEVRASWMEAVARDSGNDSGATFTEAEYTAGCETFDWGNLVAVANSLGEYGTWFTWDVESQLGYTETLVLGVGEIVTGADVPAYESDDFSGPDAGTGCGYDPEHDALVPLRLMIRNTTPGDAAQTLLGRFTLSPSGGVTVTAFLEADYSDGLSCSDQATTFDPAAIGVQLTNTDGTDTARGSSQFFVVLQDYISPRNPQGAAAELDAFTLTGEAPVNSDDPYHVIAPGSITLVGAA